MPKKTQHYQLNQWEPEDDFLRTDFNEDNAKIDAALAAHDAAIAGKTDKAATASLQALAAQKCRILFGSFEGDEAADRMIPLGATPKAVLLALEQGQIYRYPDTHGGLALEGSPLKTDKNFVAAEIVENGFRLHCNTAKSAYVNRQGSVYHYIAFV